MDSLKSFGISAGILVSAYVAGKLISSASLGIRSSIIRSVESFADNKYSNAQKNLHRHN